MLHERKSVQNTSCPFLVTASETVGLNRAIVGNVEPMGWVLVKKASRCKQKFVAGGKLSHEQSFPSAIRHLTR